MKLKKLITLLAFGCATLIIYNASHSPVSGGAPPSSTGAPGEQNCTQSGCHTDFALNAGPAMTTITFGNNETSYTPGNTYPVTVTIQEANILRFGFEALILKDFDNTNSGAIQLKQATRTQIMSGLAPLDNRSYVTYTAIGTDPVAPGKGEWTFDWVAPSTDEGPVTIYVATISADNDATQKGDWAYTTSLTLQANTISSAAIPIPLNLDVDGFEPYPNPATDQIALKLNLSTFDISSKMTVEAYNMNGQFMGSYVLPDWSMVMFNSLPLYLLPFDISSWPKGVYLLKTSNEDIFITKKLIVQ